MTIREVRTVCFVGAGTMGCINSLLAAIRGYTAVIYDVSAEALGRVTERQEEIFEYLLGKGYCDQAQIDSGVTRIQLHSDPKKAAENVDLLSESVFEQLELKREVHQRFDGLCPSHTIMTTNTSALALSEIEDVVKRGDKFAALHSHLGSLLFDIVGGPRTSSETIDVLKRYVLSLGGIPLQLKKEHPGYIYNSIIGALMTKAIMLVIKGDAHLEDVDRAWMIGQNARMGPFGWMDYVGLNVVFDVATKALQDKEKKEHAQRTLSFLRPYIQRGELGYKTGKGFYSHPSPAFQKSAFMAGKQEVAPLYEVLFTVQAARGLLLVVNGYAEIEDVDRAWMAAQNVEIGPFGLLDRMGLDVFMQLLRAQTGAGTISEDKAESIAAFLRPYLEGGELGVKVGKGFYRYPDPTYLQPAFLLGDR